MKNISKLLLMSCVSAAIFTACSDDDIVENVVPNVPGEEIAFGASARFEVDDKSSRTIYGDVSADKSYQTVLWENGDMIKIWCAEAAQATVADYKVVISDSDTDVDSELEGSEHTSMHLEKQGDGLQWSANNNHTFYAVYPGDFVKESADVNDFTPRLGFDDKSKKFTAYVPTQQSPVSVVSDGAGNYEAHPNMKYAYMVAKTIYKEGEHYGENRGVQLFFQPIVTAVELQLKASEMLLGETPQQMVITSVSLMADADANGKTQQLAGEFSVDMGENCPGTEYEGSENESHEHTVSSVESDMSSNMVTMQFAGVGGKAVTLTQGKSLTLTLFVNSLAAFEDNNNELKLMVTYNLMGSSAIKTLKLSKEMVKFKKYAFKNIYLPKFVTEDANSSNWISKLPDNVYMSQLSVPVAGNAGSHAYSGSNESYYKEQLIDIDAQWDYGVRGFEIVTSYNNAPVGTNGYGSSDILSLDQCKVVCNQIKIDDVTFGSITSKIVEKLKTSGNENECAFIICTYQSCGDRRNGNNYITALTQYIEENQEFADMLVVYDPTKTLNDYRGKICLIGRITQEGEDASVDLTTVPEKMTYIKGWGSLKDRWNKRYPGWAVWLGDVGSRSDGSTVTNLKFVEESLYNTDGTSAIAGYPTDAGDANFHYTIQVGNNEPVDNGAWVQEWSRVSDGRVVNHQIYSGILFRDDMFITWPTSIDEKKKHVEDAFVKAKNGLLAGESTVYINSLAGFYITSDDFSVGPLCFNKESSVDFPTDYAASGGDFATYNAEINQFAYDYLLKQAAANETGPMGLVIMDYIGQGEAGQMLPGMIWQNNFKVPLHYEGSDTNVEVGGDTSSDNGGFDGGNTEIISWE